MTSLSLHERDQILLSTLWHKNKQNAGGFTSKTKSRFKNGVLAERAQEEYDDSELHALEQLLKQKGTLDIPIMGGFTVEVDGAPRPVSVVAATDTHAHHGDMSSMLYLRDHVQAASALMALSLHNSVKYAQEGEQAKALLLSALHLMSTRAQLVRFNDVIARGNVAGQEDWPHISLYFNDLEAKEPNGWRNKQDTFQMLAYLTCDALARGFLQENELLDAHKTFLGSVVPLLEAVGFPLYENSGSWEEVAANRTSVMAVETALLAKMQQLVNTGKLAFLSTQLDTIDKLYLAGLQEVGRRLPSESSDYPTDNIKYRDADAALIYVLLYNLPALLAEAQISIGNHEAMTQANIEKLILERLADLDDPLTGGIMRYKDDSYQRVNFHTNQVQQVVHDIKRNVKQVAEKTGGEIDLDIKQRLRGELTPIGREAAWTHPLGQLASWAAKRSNETTGAMAASYRKQSVEYLNRMLAMVTGDAQWHAVLDNHGYYRLEPVPAFRLPECYVTYQMADGAEFMVPSPHTPLNWSSAMLRQVMGLLNYL